MSNNSAKSLPSAFFVKDPIGYNCVAVLKALFFKNSMEALLSVTGFVFGLTATAVNPLFAAVINPFLMVSRSSKPGSPKQTLVSNQPCEMCKLFKVISLQLLGFCIDVAIWVILPFSIKTSFF